MMAYPGLEVFVVNDADRNRIELRLTNSRAARAAPNRRLWGTVPGMPQYPREADTDDNYMATLLYRVECNTLVAPLVNVGGMVAMPWSTDHVKMVETYVPRHIAFAECYALADCLLNVALYAIPSTNIDNFILEYRTHVYGPAGVARPLGVDFIVARETADAIYFTYAYRAAAGPSATVVTDIIFYAGSTKHAYISQLVRSPLIQWRPGNARELVDVQRNSEDDFMMVTLVHEPDRLRQTDLRRIQHRIPYLWGGGFHNGATTLSTLAGRLTHALSCQPATVPLAGLGGGMAGLAPGPGRLSYANRAVAPGTLGREVMRDDANLDPSGGGRMPRFITWGSRSRPTILAPPAFSPERVDLLKFYEAPADLDREYEVHCSQHAERPVVAGGFMRDIQCQERVCALAGTIARRVPSQPTGAGADSEFVRNMQTTARRHQRPMDMAHTVSMLAGLDLRRGPGTYSDYIRVPAEGERRRTGLAEFVPEYSDIWHQNFYPFYDSLREHTRRIVPRS